MSSLCYLMCNCLDRLVCCIPKKVGNENKLRYSFIFLSLKIATQFIFCVVFGLYAFGVIENLSHKCIVEDSRNTPC